MLSILNYANFMKDAIECSQNQLVAIFHQPCLPDLVFKKSFKLAPIVEVVKVWK